MRIGILSDIHGNISAFERCLDFLHRQNIDKIYFLGDAIGYLPFGMDVLNILKNEGIDCIRGNHEAMLLGLLPVKEENKDIYKLSIVQGAMNIQMKEYLSLWKDSTHFEVDGRKYFFVHGSPDNHLNGYVYPDTDLDRYADIEWDVVIMGHTHYPFVRKEFDKIFVNAGSVGLPRDVGNLSSFVILDTNPLLVRHFRIEFDVDRLLSGIDKKDIHEVTIERMRRISGKAIVGELVH